MRKTLIAVLLAAAPMIANAVPISIFQSQNQTVEGEQLDFDFSPIPAAAGNSGFIQIASGPGSTFDLSGLATERFDVFLDGFAVGRYDCPPTPSHITIATCAGSSGRNTFDLVLSFADILADFGVNVGGLIADGALLVTVDFGPRSTPGLSGSRNRLDVTLSYETAAAAVAEPGTLALLGFGLVGLGLMRRRRQA